MTTMVSQITSLTIVYSTVYSDADQRKHQSSVSLAFVTGTGEFSAQRASYAENVSTSWRHHVSEILKLVSQRLHFELAPSSPPMSHPRGPRHLKSPITVDSLHNDRRYRKLFHIMISRRRHGTAMLPWLHHQMETFSALLALCEGNASVTSGFPSQRPVTRNFNVFFGLRLHERMSKQSGRRWFERHHVHYDVTVIFKTRTWRNRSLSSETIHMWVVSTEIVIE